MESQLGIILQGKPFGLDAISWSEDGTIAACFDNTAHILTPLLVGISSDLDNCLHSFVVNDLLPEAADFGESNVLDKPVQSSYAIQEGYRHVTWSPAGLSDNYGCLLTVVTTKHRVLFFQSGKKQGSDWILHSDMTPLLKEQALKDSPTLEFENLTQIDRFHSLHASWSPCVIIDPLKPAPALLAISNKAGQVSFWSYSKHHGLQWHHHFQPHTSFVNLLQWSKWRKKQNDRYIGYLFSACSDGSVVMSCIQVQVDSSTLSVRSLQAQTVHRWFEKCSMLPTLIKLWDDSSTTIKIIVVKQRVVYSLIINTEQQDDKSDWLDYMIPGTALGVSGAYFTNKGTSMQLFTHEGTGLVLCYDDSNKRLILDDTLSLKLTKQLRQKFRQHWMEEVSKYEEEEILHDFHTIPYMWGTATTPNTLYTVILFTLKCVSDVHTLVESKDTTYAAFIANTLDRNETTLSTLTDNLTHYIDNRDFLFTHPVRSILHEQLEYLLDEDDNERFMTWLHLLNDLTEKKVDANVCYSNLTRAIFSTPNIIACKVALYVSSESKSYKLEDETRDYLRELTAKSYRYIVLNFVQSVLSYVNSQEDTFWRSMTDEDILQLLLWCDRVLYISLPSADILSCVQTTYRKLQMYFPASTFLENISHEIDLVTSALSDNAPVVDINIVSRQKCPACDNPVPFSVDALCVCTMGHVFDRCSVTLKIISEPFYQICLTCSAKRCSPSSEYQQRKLPPASSSSSSSSSFLPLSDTVLLACWKCIYCGSNVKDVKP